MFGTSSGPPVVPIPKKILKHREKQEEETEVIRPGEVVSQPGVADITERTKRVNIEYEDHPCNEEQRLLEMPAASV